MDAVVKIKPRAMTNLEMCAYIADDCWSHGSGADEDVCVSLNAKGLITMFAAGEDSEFDFDCDWTDEGRAFLRSVHDKIESGEIKEPTP